MPHTREEVVAAVHAAFGGACAARVLAALDVYGTEPHERERERVQLAIVALSQGNEDSLLQLVQSARTDYRDVLAWQETGPLSPQEGRAAQEAALRTLRKWGSKLP